MSSLKLLCTGYKH